MTGWGSGGPHSGVPAEKPEILCGRTVRTLTSTLWILQAVSWATMHFFLIIPQNRSEQSLQGHGPGVTSQHWAIPAVPFSWKVGPQARHGNIAEVLWLSVSGTSPGRSQVMDGAGPPDDLPGASLEATACHSPSPPPTSSTKRERKWKVRWQPGLCGCHPGMRAPTGHLPPLPLHSFNNPKELQTALTWVSPFTTDIKGHGGSVL